MLRQPIGPTIVGGKGGGGGTNFFLGTASSLSFFFFFFLFPSPPFGPQGVLVAPRSYSFRSRAKKKKKEKEKVFFSPPHFKPRLVSSEENPE